MATIKEFKALVAPDVLSCPDTIINREVVSVLLEFCQKTNILTREMTLEIDTDDIDADLQDAIDFDIHPYINDLRPITVLDLMVDSAIYVPKKRLIQQTHSNWAYIKEDGTKFYTVPEDHLIRVFDMSTSDRNIYMKVACKPKRDVTEVDDFLLEDHAEAIIAGAKFKLLAMPGKEWSDGKSALFYRAEWRKYLSQAKSEAINNLPGFTDRVNPVDFEYGA